MTCRRFLCLFALSAAACGGDVTASSPPSTAAPSAEPPLPAPDAAVAVTPDAGSRALRPKTPTWSKLDLTCRGHTANALLDGRVLVVGDCATAELADLSAVVFDPNAGLLTPIPTSWPDERSAHSATTLPDGRVLIVGGSWNGGSSATALLFDGNGFGPAASLGVPRSKHAASLLPDGRVLVTGGWTGTKSLASTEIWSASGGFVPGPDLPAPRSEHVSIRMETDVWLFGGGQKAPSRFANHSFQVGPEFAGSESIRSATPLPNGHLLLMPTFSAPVLFDPSLGTAELISSANPELPHRALAPIADRFLAVGGSLWALPPTPVLFDPESKTFSEIEPGGGEYDVTATPLQDGRVLVVGQQSALLSLS